MRFPSNDARNGYIAGYYKREIHAPYETERNNEFNHWYGIGIDDRRRKLSNQKRNRAMRPAQPSHAKTTG